jgi:hypothetical protein
MRLAVGTYAATMYTAVGIDGSGPPQPTFGGENRGISAPTRDRGCAGVAAICLALPHSANLIRKTI